MKEWEKKKNSVMIVAKSAGYLYLYQTKADFKEKHIIWDKENQILIRKGLIHDEYINYIYIYVHLQT